MGEKSVSAFHGRVTYSPNIANFADDFVSYQNLRTDHVPSQTGDMGVAVVAGQYRQQPGARCQQVSR